MRRTMAFSKQVTLFIILVQKQEAACQVKESHEKIESLLKRA